MRKKEWQSRGKKDDAWDRFEIMRILIQLSSACRFQIGRDINDEINERNGSLSYLPCRDTYLEVYLDRKGNSVCWSHPDSTNLNLGKKRLLYLGGVQPCGNREKDKASETRRQRRDASDQIERVRGVGKGSIKTKCNDRRKNRNATNRTIFLSRPNRMCGLDL